MDGATPKIFAGTQTTEANLTGGTSRFRVTSMNQTLSQIKETDQAPLQGKFKNGLDNHAKLVENYM